MLYTNKKMIRALFRISLLVIAGSIIAACNSVPVPRPRGYFKITFPEKQYRLFDKEGFPYSFEYPVYARIVKDSTYFDEQPENPYWINIDFPQFNGKLYLSYKNIGGPNSLDKLVNDAFKLTSKHSLKATSIDYIPVNPSPGVAGFLFEVGGNAATARQFFVTDSTRHFLRGALYFDATPNEDSLKPVNNFLYQDMQYLIKTLRWK